MGPKSNDWYRYKSGNAGTGTQTHRGKGHVMTEAEIRAMHLQAKEYQGLLATLRAGRGRILPLKASEELGPADTSISDF